jgi:EAL and modified HD-GYP domain-containing signal transduction protein
MVGILSLIDNIIDKPLADIVSELNLGTQLAKALLEREGELGVLLQLAESIEQADLAHTRTLLEWAPPLSLADLTAAEIEAMSWANQVAETAV